MKLLIQLTLMLLICGGCSTPDSGVYKKSERIENNLQQNVPAPWSKINNEGSDFALINKKNNSIFLLNSSCRKFEGSDLNILTSSLLTGLQDLVVMEKKGAFYHDREAVEVTASGKLDGITRYFKIVTLLKNNCIYDYALIATNALNLNQDSKDFYSFLERIRPN